MSRADAVSQARAEAYAPDHRIVEEAADWLVRLDAGALGESQQQALEDWRSQSPEHERVWRAAVELKGLIGAVPGTIGAPVLGRERLDRRTVLKSLAGLLVVAPAGWMAYQRLPWREWTADYRTTAGEQREVTLPDGSLVLLNTASAVDVAFDGASRHLILHSGEIFIETAPDPATRSRPFLVQTEQGRIRALGTRFGVREINGRDANRTQVAVLAHAVAIRPAHAATETVLEAGQQTGFTRHTVGKPQAVEEGSTAWTRGQIIADKQRLGDFASELARYRPGILRCDPAVADLRISGVFQISDTDHVLSIIEETLPVRVSFVTGYWVSVGPRD